MSTQWLTTMKPSFQTEWLALPPKESHQVLEKIHLLSEDPLPDGDIKIQLKHIDSKLHRIRCGDYRIIYTLEKPYISLLALRRRREGTYNEDFDPDFLGGFDPQFEETKTSKIMQPDWEKYVTEQKKPLPEPITEELLTRLHIPCEYHARLIRVHTQDDLLNCPGVPDDYLLLIDQCMFERPLIQVLQQPDYLLNDVNDLFLYKEGELLGFLLKLSPEQEKYVNWVMSGSGPTLLKGGPGTGKSTIALYRVRSLVHELRKKGRTEFRIIFTTYTNALVKSSEQLLQQLLGEDMKHVEVQTADSLVVTLLRQVGAVPKFIEHGEFNNLLRQAIKVASFEGNAVQQQAQRQAIERLSIDYLHQEINQVIVARQVNTLEEYLSASRPGRKVGLNALQRRAIWQVYETLQRLLKQQGKETWHRARALAEEYVAEGIVSRRYDAVVVDEAQDLDPSMLRLLIKLCKSPNRLFITADANQSIYGSGFTWTDVHESLRFRGRTSVLKANYRSTREIGEAAQSYLSEEMLDTEQIERIYVNNGPLPIVRLVRSKSDELDILIRFFRLASREFRLGLGSCALFCPSNEAGQTIASGLISHGVEAHFMSGRKLDLKQKGVKVLTLKSSKGLEFPVVALAGFIDGSYPIIPADASVGGRKEILARERRTMFVGMTRAMRVLLVTVPTQAKSPLLQGFDGEYWNLGG